jgi:hypothetical protein
MLNKMRIRKSRVDKCSICRCSKQTPAEHSAYSNFNIKQFIATADYVNKSL